MPKMLTQSRPLHDADISRTSIPGHSSIFTASVRSVLSKVTSTATMETEKPKQKKKEKKKKKPNKLFGFMKSAADYLILDDVKTVVDLNDSLLSKGFAVFSETPASKGLKAANLGFKLVRKSPFGKAVVKKTDKAVEVAKSKQRSVIKSVENGNIRMKTNKQKGNYDKMKMDVHFEKQGYQRLGKERVTSLDDKIVKGIDGVYEKTGPPRKFVIGEAKFNTGQLGKTKDGKQMSETWIEGGNRLESAVGKDKAREIRREKMLNPENVQKVLMKIKPNGTTIQKEL